MKKLLTCIALVLAGCATKQPAWYKDGATQEMWHMDQGQCQAQAFSVPASSLFQQTLVFSSCMKGKGWYYGD